MRHNRLWQTATMAGAALAASVALTAPGATAQSAQVHVRVHYDGGETRSYSIERGERRAIPLGDESEWSCLAGGMIRVRASPQLPRGTRAFSLACERGDAEVSMPTCGGTLYLNDRMVSLDCGGVAQPGTMMGDW